MEPVLLTDILPCAALQNYVRKYQVYRFSFEKSSVPPVKFHTPRPEHSITFYVRDAQKFSPINSSRVSTYPQCVINGIYTFPINRYGGYDFCAIKVVLQPTTLSRLKVIQVKQLNNNYINAEDCLGKEVSFLCEQLFMMNDLKDMIGSIERFLIQLINKSCKSLEPIDKTSQLIVKHEGNISLNWLAAQSCLSVRQFIRRFEEHIGVSPKMFQKIIRLDRAYRLKNNNSTNDWLCIALASGYYDYQHLVKDFKEFIHLTPTAFYEIEKASPERTFSLHEG
jgi:AraC-like DNA-binding protein